jgi:hypothetical protein
MTQIQRNSTVEYGNKELPEKLLCCPSSHGESKSILVEHEFREFRENPDDGSAYFDCLFKHLQMAFGLHW